MVLGITPRPQALTAGAGEKEGGGVHEDYREVAEEVAPPGEELFLDQILHTAPSAGHLWPERLLVRAAQGLAQPGHGPVEVV